MTYDQLRVLDAIITQGSFTAASKHLFLSQPSVSVAIRKLEEEFELKLFSRGQYRPTLTAEGEAFYQKVKMVLDQTEALEVLGKQLAMGQEPEICIAVDAVFPLSMISGLLKHYEKEHSATRLYLGTEYLSGAVERVLDGSADLGLIPGLEEHSGLEAIRLTSIKMIPVAAPLFCPTHSTRDLNNSDMEAYVQVIVKDSSSRPTFEKSHGVLEGGRKWWVNDFFTKKQILLEGLGWGRLPEHLIEEELKEGSLVPLSIKNVKTLQVEMQAVRRIGKPVGPIARSLWLDFQTLGLKGT